jgi:hypothetical protein
MEQGRKGVKGEGMQIARRENLKHPSTIAQRRLKRRVGDQGANFH